MNALDQLGVPLGDVPREYVEAMRDALKAWRDCGDETCKFCLPNRVAFAYLEVRLGLDAWKARQFVEANRS